ncbi:hypothetical protein ACLB2K_035872 [Fragaria x ananassa]
MGDECIDIRGKDEQFSIQPIRRSFSMDSSNDRHLYLAVQEAVQQQSQVSEVSPIEGCSSSTSSRIRSWDTKFDHNLRGHGVQPWTAEAGCALTPRRPNTFDVSLALNMLGSQSDTISTEA